MENAGCLHHVIGLLEGCAAHVEDRIEAVVDRPELVERSGPFCGSLLMTASVEATMAREAIREAWLACSDQSAWDRFWS